MAHSSYEDDGYAAADAMYASIESRKAKGRILDVEKTNSQLEDEVNNLKVRLTKIEALFVEAEIDNIWERLEKL